MYVSLRSNNIVIRRSAGNIIARFRRYIEILSATRQDSGLGAHGAAAGKRPIRPRPVGFHPKTNVKNRLKRINFSSGAAADKYDDFVCSRFERWMLRMFFPPSMYNAQAVGTSNVFSFQRTDRSDDATRITKKIFEFVVK